MYRHFSPTRAAQASDSDRKFQRYLVSKAELSMNWRAPAPTATTPPRLFAFVGGAIDTATAKEDSFRNVRAGVSHNYRGDPNVASNHSAAIPDSENTNLWVTGFPRECASYKGLMDMLEGRGRIRAANFSQDNPGYRTAAVTITFFRHVDAANTMQAINDGTLRVPLVTRAATDLWAKRVGDSSVSSVSDDWDDLIGPELEEPTLIDLEPVEMNTRALVLLPDRHLDGIKLRACWNRVRVAEWKPLYFNPMPQHLGFQQLPSRVIRVRGPANEVKPASLQVYFKSRFRYNLDRIVFRGTKYDREEYEYRFASWKNQAEFAVMSLRREKPDIMVWYGADPCEVVEENIHILDKDDPDAYVNIPVLTATDSSVESEVEFDECD
ncbi:hypothetical protein O1611_g3564 [Lasiodiplodia mahajangana]|uniref:Uncharacterized protein n=1 Tax=Lasiodiplodia mahajangana TaxID=1108764 RepID=A0ACC2JRF7_9PEZI|nr:hypothetical protein O1611_g3564 [Lasiodiplodia mahajangana]